MTTGFLRTLSVMGILLLAACRYGPVQNVSSASFDVPNLTMEQAGSAIVRGGASLGWQIREQGPGHMIATLTLRRHKAVVDITYDTSTFSIKYKDSHNLRYDGTNIHSNYNGWISNLENAIKAQARVT